MTDSWTGPGVVVRHGRLWGSAADPARVALRFVDGPSLTHAQLWSAVADREDEFAAARLHRGDVLCLLQENTPDLVLDLLASFRLGIVVVPLNTALRGASLEAVLHDVGPCLLRCGPALVEVGLAAADAVEGAGLWPVGAAAPRVRSGPRDRPIDGRAESDVAAIMLTSGTTGLPKGVVWPHAMALAFAEHTTWVMGYREDDVIYTCLPLFHINGLFCALYAGLLTGAEVVIARRFSAATYWRDIAATGATVTNMMGSIPAILWRGEPGAHERKHRLRLGMVLPLPADRAAFEERFGFPTTEVYGSTDTGLPLGIPFGSSRPGSCGRPTPGWECDVVDEDDHPVGDGVEGELVVRPRRPHIGFAGYWRHPEATVAATRNLWLHTGDVVTRDADGWFTYRGRRKEMIRVSGENVAPLQVEAALLRHPDVLEVAAYAVPSDLGEESVAVAVVPRAGADVHPADLRALAERDLPYFAVPRFVLLTDELPKTATAKVVKADLEALGVTAEHWDGGRPRRQQ
ncbi:AMP-binding protein [Nocardioides sp. LHD-245]|uniref:AMP-binding protein n=1 Tax=Nocardioides sp. LHD-245 TaxID=3051387 RepID=UPI0027DFC773|nr:AMP-binding protein [Nocardioides sp. LHD-245]